MTCQKGKTTRRPTDNYDVEAWNRYFAENPHLFRSVGAAGDDGNDDGGTGDGVQNGEGDQAGGAAANSGQDGDGNDGTNSGDASGDSGGDGQPKGIMDLVSGDEAGDDREGREAGRVIQVDGQDVTVPEAFWDTDKGEVNVGALLKSFKDTKASHDRLQTELKDRPEAGEIPESVEGYLTDEILAEGKVKTPDGIKNLSEISSDDPSLEWFTTIAQEASLTTEQFTKILQSSMIHADGLFDGQKVEEKVDPEAEIQKLGPNGRAQVATAKSWVVGIHEAGELSAEEMNSLIDFGQTARGTAALLKLRAQTGAPPIPGGDAGDAGDVPSLQSLYANKPDHRTDPEAYEKWRENIAKATSNAPAGESRRNMGVPASAPARGPGQSNTNVDSRGRR